MASSLGVSDTKKLYSFLAMNQLLAGCIVMMSMMSSPLKLPVRPRNVFSESSWSSGLYSNCQSMRPEGQIESLDARTLI